MRSKDIWIYTITKRGWKQQQKKFKKIITYLYLDENSVYTDKTKFLTDFFIFMPCLILDFRIKDNQNYYLSCSDFIDKLHYNKNTEIKEIIEDNKRNFIDNVESSSFQDLFNITNNNIVSNFDFYNNKLGPQRKGELYEKIVFILFSLLFQIEKIGGPNKHDGNIFVSNNDFLGYDAKNLENNQISNFLDGRNKKFKDRKYIEKNKIKYYFFIFKRIKDEFFNSLVQNIKKDFKKDVYIKAFDLEFIKRLFNEITNEGVLNYSRTHKQELIKLLLENKDVILR